MNIETMHATVDLLIANGITASLEYPGFISVELWDGEKCDGYCVNIGDANGDLAGDVVDDHQTFLFGYPLAATAETPEGIASVIAAAIPTMRSIVSRAHTFIDDMDDEFGMRLSRTFPEANTGDIDPLASHRHNEATRKLVFDWIAANVVKS